MTAVTIDALQRNPALTAATETAAAARPAAQLRQKQSQAVEFEAFVLQSFVETMLPKNSEASFGGGAAGASWRSMMAEKIAAEIAASGGIGIAKLLARPDAAQLPPQDEPVSVGTAPRAKPEKPATPSN